MPFINSPVDGAQLFYRDWSPAPAPVPFRPGSNSVRTFDNAGLALVFIHGWPLSSQMFDHLMLPLCENYRLRCIAPDRRGFGKSDWNGHDQRASTAITYDTFAQDTVAILESLGLKKFIFVAASMGCGETALAYTKFMTPEMKRACKGFFWVGASLPHPLATAEHPNRPSRELWDMILDGFRNDPTGFVTVSLPGVFKGTCPDIAIEDSWLQKFNGIVAQADALAIERCVQIITGTDFTKTLLELGALTDVKVVVLHGDSDQGT